MAHLSWFPADRTRLILLLAAIPVFVLYLGANSIWDANEAFYVETPRQMVLTGDYLNPSFNGLPRFNKPVLSYWIVAGLYKVFGVSVTVERAGMAAGAVGIMVAAFLIGRAMRSTRTGLLAALMIATAPRLVMFARRIFIDVYVTLFMSLALAGFVMAERHPEHRRRWLLLTYVAMGLGVLTKGPVAIVLPALAAGLWLAIERRLSDLRRLWLLPGAAIVLAIVLPWYAADYAQHGWTHIARFFLGENLGRYATSMTSGDRGVWFYLPVLLGDLFPWAPLIVIPLAVAWRGRRADESRPHASIRRLLWCWIVVIVAAFSFSNSKEDLYILPVVCAVAALVADMFADADAPPGLGFAVAAVSVVCVGLGGAVAWLLGSGAYALAGARVEAVVLGAAGCGTLAWWTSGRRQAAVAWLAAGFVLVNYVFVARVLPDAERFKPVPALVRTLSARAGPDAEVASFNMGLPSLVYYLGRSVPELASLDEAAAFLTAGHDAWLVTGDGEWTRLHQRVAAACVAGRHMLFPFDNLKLSALRRGDPAPDVVLVTSHCGDAGAASAANSGQHGSQREAQQHQREPDDGR
jgi:4-amino-4-deoxy-L-arabinose transferase-like glycosyltransferase